jgi:hypothetical protein
MCVRVQLHRMNGDSDDAGEAAMDQQAHIKALEVALAAASVAAGDGGTKVHAHVRLGLDGREHVEPVGAWHWPMVCCAELR